MSRSSRWALGPLLLASLLTACAVRSPPSVPVSLDGLAFSASGDASVPDAWWTALGDPALDAHVRDALGANFSVRAAFARLDGAEAVVPPGIVAVDLKCNQRQTCVAEVGGPMTCWGRRPR